MTSPDGAAGAASMDKMAAERSDSDIRPADVLPGAPPGAEAAVSGLDPAAGPDKRIASGIKTVNLALQGGGAHGAFTWGVLDRLLEDGRIAFEGISGTSAGAMNAAVLLQGWIEGGREGARRTLDRFWRRVSDYSAFNPLQQNFFDRLMGNWNFDNSPAYLFYDALTRFLSPYQFNPLNWNPLRTVLAEIMDFGALHAAEEFQLYVSATNVQTGKIRVFERRELTLDVLLASACLPNLFQAVEIGGEPYWDGGYMGNPAIFPLIYGCKSRDVVIVQTDPLYREGTPRTTAEIMNRINEITFNSSLQRELRAIGFVQRLIQDQMLQGEHANRLKRMHLHMVESEQTMEALGASSKMNTNFDFLLLLKEAGRRQAELWLADSFDALGQRTSIDIHGIIQ